MTREMKILLVEDDQAQSDLMLEVLSECKFSSNKPSLAVDGEQVMDILHQRNGYEASSRPDLILLDLDIPKKSGQQVLQEIKSDEKLKSIPVLVLTSSQSQEVIKLCYRQHANAYMVKPADFHGLVGLVESVESFWFSQVCYS